MIQEQAGIQVVEQVNQETGAPFPDGEQFATVTLLRILPRTTLASALLEDDIFRRHPVMPGERLLQLEIFSVAVFPGFSCGAAHGLHRRRRRAELGRVGADSRREGRAPLPLVGDSRWFTSDDAPELVLSEQAAALLGYTAENFAGRSFHDGYGMGGASGERKPVDGLRYLDDCALSHIWIYNIISNNCLFFV